MPVNEFQFAEAYTELTVRGKGKFNATLDEASASLEKLQMRLTGVARHARRMLLVGGGALGLFVKMAADAEETANKFNAVFRENADLARTWADNLAKGIGRFRLDLEETMSSFQGFFVGLGFGQDEALKLSKRMQSLSLDFASFNNLADAEAAQRFISALSGSSEVLDMFGINIKQAAIDQELLNMGMGVSAAKADEQQKALARVNIIMRAMGEQGAIGDAAKTAGSLANQFKALTADAKALAVQVGEAVVPVVRDVVKHIRELIGVTGAFTDAQKDSIAQWALFGATALGIIAILPQLIAGLQGVLATVALLGGTSILGGAVGVLIGALTLLAATFVTAKLRGKEFGEQVLDLAREIGILSDAYEEYRKLQSESLPGMSKERLAEIERDSTEFQQERATKMKAGAKTPGEAGTAAVESSEEVRAARAERERRKSAVRAAKAELDRAQAQFERDKKWIERRAPDDAPWLAEKTMKARLPVSDAQIKFRQAEEALARKSPQVDALVSRIFDRAAEEFRQKQAAEEGAKVLREWDEAAQDFGKMLTRERAERKAVADMNFSREAEERGFGRQMLEELEKGPKRQPAEGAIMTISQVQGYLQQQLLSQKPTQGDKLIEKAVQEGNKKLGEIKVGIDKQNFGWQ